MAAVKKCPVLHFSVVVFFWSFGIIDASTIKCCEVISAQAGARGREGCFFWSFGIIDASTIKY
jgi:hypothetical protein